MQDSENVGTTTGVEFGVKDFQANAILYRSAKGVMDGASKFESLDDAIAALTEVWEAMETQVEVGAGFTPPTDLGFGSDNGAVIAESILGRRNTVSATRKSFNSHGKVD